MSDEDRAQPKPPRGALARRIDLDAHEWSVLLPLALVGFFTNYDTGLLSLAAPDIADGLGVSVAVLGIGVAVIRMASLLSIPLLRSADRLGRRTLLLVSVLGFTLATGLTALSWSLAAFVVFQFVARAFLTTEETLAGVVLTEEMRPDRRGRGISLLGIISTAGFGLVAILLLVVDRTPLGFRLFYVVALLPLLVVIYLRRNLRETTAFGVASDHGRLQVSWWPRLEGQDRHRLLRLCVPIGFAGMLGTAAFFYAAELAQDGYGWEGLFTVIVFAAAPATLGGYIVGGRVSDRHGRRPVSIGACLVLALGTALVFSQVRALYAPGFFLLAGADAAFQAARTAYVGELFPTEVRATLSAFVGAVNVAAGSLGLVVVGILAGAIDSSTAVLGLAALSAVATLVLRTLPETVGTDVVYRGPPPAQRVGEGGSG